MNQLKTNKRNTKEFSIPIFIFAFAMVIALAQPIAYRASEDTRNIQVKSTQIVVSGKNSKYLVFTNGEVYENTDSLLFFKWNSSDVQAQLTPSKRYRVKTAGWRIPFFSTYRNIIEAEEIK